MIFKKLIVAITIILSITFFNTCEKSTDPISDNKFQIYVDSLHVPETINLADTVICKFWGFIGYNLCYQFSHFETIISSESIDFKLWGYNTEANVCATALSELRGKEYKFIAEKKGTIRIKVLQPDNSVIINYIIVQ